MLLSPKKIEAPNIERSTAEIKEERRTYVTTVK